jgi:hypothetical protein
LAGWLGDVPKGRGKTAHRRPVGAVQGDPAAIVLQASLPLDEARARLAGRAGGTGTASVVASRLARHDRDDIARLLAEALDQTGSGTPRLGDR